ncbi:LytR cell envelope-related transcriptional attenuator [Bifidobacterium thermophilum]|nr:LytR cell envelope-related transcriptional attenuator [Bifidobacterium thermophilum]
MARKDRNTDESYAEDVFDNPPQGPVGVHRGNRSVAARLVPFLIVIVVAAVAGLTVWAVMSGEGAKVMPWKSAATSSQTAPASKSSKSSKSSASESPSASASQSASASASESESASASPSDSQSPSASPSQSQTPAAAANLTTQVRVVNGTKKTGYAATQASVLQKAGYTNVVAANPSGSLPAGSVVWYQNEADVATAQDVAAKLGISNVRQVSNLSAPVVVVLMN